MLTALAEDAGILDGEDAAEIEEDEVPEVPVDPITKPGDLWILGDHRLLCGDSTKAEDVERLMGGEVYELLMTDPPYGINAANMTMGAGQSSRPKPERLSNVSNWDSRRPSIKHLLGAGKCCVWGGNYFAEDLPISDDWLCWHKKNDSRSFGEFELAWSNFGRRTRLFSHHWGGEKKQHITQKPVAVIAWAINQSETTGIVADFFLGSGTTLIAAEQLGRKCYGMEISPQYCDVIVKRWETLTGRQAERRGGDDQASR
jgi:DNA modification methylase